MAHAHFEQTFMREFMSKLGAIHTIKNGVITFPESPPLNGVYDPRHKLLDYSQPFKKYPYNAKVVRGIAESIRTAFETTPEGELPFLVHDSMLDIEAIEWEVKDIATHTKTKWKQATKQAAAKEARGEDDAMGSDTDYEAEKLARGQHKRHGTRKSTVRRLSCDTYCD
jgi:hypothetical protein